MDDYNSKYSLGYYEKQDSDIRLFKNTDSKSINAITEPVQVIPENEQINEESKDENILKLTMLLIFNNYRCHAVFSDGTAMIIHRNGD